MDGKKVCKTLPDHLVERIIAMIPFPAIFQARCLSKSWLTRFSSIASQDDEAIKRISKSFQKLVSEKSKKWGTFCPVFIGTNGELTAYDHKAQNWQKMPPVSFLPKNVRCDMSCDMQIDGALLYASNFTCREDMYVANILTRTWRRLPFPPISGCPLYTSKLAVIDRSLGTYKVILFSQRNLYEPDYPLFQIYDSKLDSWSCIKLNFKWYTDDDDYGGFLFRNSVFLGDILYVPTACQHLFAVNVRQGTFEELKLRFSCPYEGWEGHHSLVVCGEELLMVLSVDDYDTSPIVLRVDLPSSRVDECNSSPPFLKSLESSRAMAPVGNKDHIFFGYVIKDGSSRMRAYNFADDLWSASFAASSCGADYQYNWITSFQPGLAPFAAV